LRATLFRMVVLGAAVLVLLIGLVALGFGLATANSGRLSALRSEQATATNLLVALQNQAFAVRDYMSSADPEVLGTYTQGRTAADDALRQLGRDTAGTLRGEELRQAEAAIRSWQGWAEDMRRQVAASGPVSDPIAIGEGMRRFSNVLSHHAALQADEENDASAASASTQWAVGFGVVCLVGGSVLVGSVLLILTLQVRGSVLAPLQQLAQAALLIAAGEQTQIPDAERFEEIGELARALQAWRDASAEREILIDQAPIGICRIDRKGRVVALNPTLQAMHSGAREAIAGRSWQEFIHPDDRPMLLQAYSDLSSAGIDRRVIEARHVRADGTLRWSLLTVAGVPGPDGQPEGFIVIVEDISSRKREAQRARQIQGRLLPQATLEIEGYELTGTCRPSLEVAGDLYDWMPSGDAGVLLTVADVMGKGVPAALVMTTLRTMLRAAPPTLGPAARVQLVADSLPFGDDDEGLYVTLFHALLDVTSGVLRYVDAGHGHCAIRRFGGELVQMEDRSLPLGILAGQRFSEGVVQLHPGDALVAYSDGLVEKGDDTIELAELLSKVDDTVDAAGMVARLIGTVPEPPSDDVTLVVLRRLPNSRLHRFEDAASPVASGTATASLDASVGARTTAFETGLPPPRRLV
jgi:PAS domain S-box-containing protein